MYICIYTSTIYIISYIRDSILQLWAVPDDSGWVCFSPGWGCFSLRSSFPVKTRGFALWRSIFSKGAWCHYPSIPKPGA